MPSLARRDLAVAAALVALGQAEVWLAEVDGSKLPAAALALVATASVALRNRRPVAVAVVVSACVGGAALAGAFEPDVLAELIALVVALYTVAIRTALRIALATAAVCLLLVWIGVATSPVHNAGAYGFIAIVVATPVLAGRALRDRETHVDTLRGENQRLEAEREEAAAAERERIARELHDVVAHGLSVIVIQAAAGVRAADRETAITALREVERVGRDAYDDMQRMVGVLRRGGTAELAPQPGLGDLERLADGFRRSGRPVSIEVDLDGTHLGPSLELALFRIVQEAMTNVAKHAGPGASTRVRVRREPESVILDVVDDGAAADASSPLRGGRGLAGMRERAQVFGGRLDAGPRSGGGFGVEVAIPL